MKNGRCYDKFHGRLIFPIRDHRGAVVAFGGRTSAVPAAAAAVVVVVAVVAVVVTERAADVDVSGGDVLVGVPIRDAQVVE